MLVDSHCHLDFPDFAEERAAVVARAHAAGVGQMVTISTRVKRFEQIKAIAEEFDSVWCSVGTHPHNAAEELDITADDLVRLVGRIRRSSRSARPASTIFTTSRRATPRRKGFARISRPPARPSFRW